MTKIIDGLHVLTYDEWIKTPEISNMLEEAEECLTCDGEGIHECECGDTHDCGNCSRTGKSKIEDLSDEYNRTLRNELQKLIAWKKGLKTKNPSAYLEERDQDYRTGIVTLKIPNNVD